MREYPDSSKAMDLIAEHRLRALRSSDAWLAKHGGGARPPAAASAASLGSKIEHVLEVGAGERFLRVSGTRWRWAPVRLQL